MRRREFITLLGALAAGLPLNGARSADRVKRLGVLMSNKEGDPVATTRVAKFREGLARLGWYEGQNLQIEWRWGGGDIVLIRRYADELVQLAPDILLCNGTPATVALKQATTTIPIVFSVVNDPVSQGIIPSMAHPGGNITGFSFLEYSMVGKSLEMLKRIAPQSTSVAIMFNPETYPYYEIHLKSFEAVAKQLSLGLSAAPVKTLAEIDETFAKLGRQPGSTVLVTPDPFMLVNRGAAIKAAAQYRVPASYSYRQIAQEGGLTTYGADAGDIFFRSAGYIDRILKGTAPGDLPAQAPVKFETAFNVRTAKALGLEIPPDLLALADEVVE
jgi:putative tryptophan/tyrosine transport system substrate-binding protein